MIPNHRFTIRTLPLNIMGSLRSSIHLQLLKKFSSNTSSSNNPVTLAGTVTPYIQHILLKIPHIKGKI